LANGSRYRLTNTEEEVQLTKVVPFLVEDELKRLGGLFEKKDNWQPFAITDGRLIAGRPQCGR